MGEREVIMKTRYTVVLSMIAGAAVGAAAIQGLHAQAKKVYMISESEIVGDRGALDAYNAQVQKALQTLVARSSSATMLPKCWARLRSGSALPNSTAWRKLRPGLTRRSARRWLHTVRRR